MPQRHNLPSVTGTNRATGPSAGRTSKASAGASLIERRKAATRMEIARAAAGLFMADGLRATRAEDIARAAGVAPRTFYRYFATKEESLAPSSRRAPTSGRRRCAKPPPHSPSRTPCTTPWSAP
ncbi:hypothetical protein SAV31267_056950 [Streptomyces avermitilis]|uniref:HTH tetR-type domain-containing protein n=1 Tax=Streptomyces avermitilis TaxID=33903 RepID=A0A4D4MVL5_STRAX|nr:hypothetical protein SAV31267_056950 [Streptomyces avermitilis]